MSNGKTIGKTMTQFPGRSGAQGQSARTSPERRRPGRTARRRPADPRSLAWPSRARASLRSGPVRELDDAELDPAFDEFGDLADHVDGLAVHMRDHLARSGRPEYGSNFD